MIFITHMSCAYFAFQIMGNSAAHLKEVFQRTEPPFEPESPACAQIQNLVDPRSPTDLFTRTPIEV